MYPLHRLPRHFSTTYRLGLLGNFTPRGTRQSLREGAWPTFEPHSYMVLRSADPSLQPLCSALRRSWRLSDAGVYRGQPQSGLIKCHSRFPIGGLRFLGFDRHGRHRASTWVPIHGPLFWLNARLALLWTSRACASTSSCCSSAPSTVPNCSFRFAR